MARIRTSDTLCERLAREQPIVSDGAVASTQRRRPTNRLRHVLLGLFHGLDNTASVREPRRNCRRKCAAGPMRVGRVEAFCAEDSERVTVKEHVDRGALTMPTLHHDGPRPEVDDLARSLTNLVF